MNDVCQLLKETRIGKGLSLEEVAQRTYIKLHYLEALEEGLLDRLPAMVHTYGYIRQYAKLLGLDGGALVAQFQQQERAGAAPKTGRTPTAELLGETLSFLKPIKASYGSNGNGHAYGTANGNGNGAYHASSAIAPPPEPAPEETAGPMLPTLPPIDSSHAYVPGPAAPEGAPAAVTPPSPVAPAYFRPAAVERTVPAAPAAPTPQEIADARAQAQQILLSAEREARNLVRGAESYADEVLGQLEAEVSATLQVVQNGRQFLAMRRRPGPQGLG